MTEALLSILIDWLPYLLEGVVLTLGLIIAALGIGLLLGLPMALGQIYGSKTVRYIIEVYVWFPGPAAPCASLLFYFGVFPALGLDIPAFIIAIVVLGLRGAAYQSQIFRGAILSISEGQMTAARSLGMTRWQAIRTVILPQAMLIALPGWSDEYPTVLTDTSICYAIGVMELLTRTSEIVSQTYLTMPIYLACACVYIALNYAGMKCLDKLENKVMVPGFGHAST